MTYLFLGYTVIWTLLFVYLLYISGRQRALEREMAWIRDHLSTRAPEESSQAQSG
ncbi:MAG: CcmD family protein [Bacillota bacterium]